MPPKEVTDLKEKLERRVLRLTRLGERISYLAGKSKEQLSAVDTTLALLCGRQPEDNNSEGKALAVNAFVRPPQLYGGGVAVPLRPTVQELDQAYEATLPLFTIREVIKNLPPHFSESEAARSMASNLLRRKEEEGKVFVMERGTGRRPSLYQKNPDGLVAGVGPSVSLKFSDGSQGTLTPVQEADDVNDS